MPLISNRHLYKTTMFQKFDGIRHGISGRFMGDARNQKVRSRILESEGLSETSLINLQQIHGASVMVINDTRRPSDRVVADGLVTKEPGRILAVKTADCVPLILVDPVSSVVAVAHSGWRGTIANIAGAVVSEMVRLGSHTKNIYACIGPHIGDCCYTVGDERAQLFTDRFGRRSLVAKRSDKTWVLGLGKANQLLLVESGIDPTHIDANSPCTSCFVDTFYSYRKDSKETFGEMMSFVVRTV